jgi:hypothetical protein
MRAPAVRFTIRRMMIAVAVFGVVLGVWLELSRLARIAAARRRDAASYAASEAIARKFALQYSRQAQQYLSSAESSGPSNAGFLEELRRVASYAESAAARYRRNADYWAMMNKKYERAARAPWSSVEPDPQPPIE